MRNFFVSTASILTGLLFVLVLSHMAVAAPTSPLSVSLLNTSTRLLPNSSTSGIGAQGGNVTELAIDALTITKAWQGYYGNVTGNIHLDDAANNSFYVWGNATGVSGEVYASRNSSPDWSTINCSNTTQRTLENTYLGLSLTDGDSVINTFNATSHPSFYVGSRQMNANSCFSTNIFVNGTSQNTSFYQILLADETNNTVYTTIIESDAYGYNSRRMDFQLMVGENEHFGSEGPSSYYFFVELN